MTVAPLPQPDVRASLVMLMRATLADRRNWTYRAVRPMSVPFLWNPGQHVTADCSKAVQFLCRWAGAPDPMGNGWDVWGNSTTIAAHLPHLLVPAALRPGDVVTFGPDGTQHAAMVLEGGVDPVLWSHGHQGAPNTYRLSEDRREHQLLRLPVVERKPSPADLRSKTGYWSWLKWSLAEGEWAGYKPWDKSVRPSVPRLIPVSWWRRRVVFLRGRKKPNDPKGL